eukprot:s7031_g7.t1
MDATLKRAHHPRARLLELDVGVSRLRLIDISEVPLCSEHRAPAPTDASACTSTRSPASFGMKPKAKACDQPRNNGVPMEGTLRKGAAGDQSGAAGSRGIPSLRKTRFAKIRGSLRECLRRRPDVVGQLTIASRQSRKGPSVRPRAFKRRQDGVPILASSTPVLECLQWKQPIPCDPEPTTAAEQDGKMGDKDYDAIYKARLTRILADERKCSLLMWQRAQPLGHWLDVLQHNAQVLCRYLVPDVLYDIFTMRNEVIATQLRAVARHGYPEVPDSVFVILRTRIFLKNVENTEEAGIKEVIRMLMQVSIRHEDHINLLRLDRSFLLWMKTSSPETMLPNIVAASKAWKEKREAGITDTSLRVTLFRCLMVELKNRATQMVENPELRAKLVTAGWLQVRDGQEPMWNPMMWSRTEEKEILEPMWNPMMWSRTEEKEILVPDQGPMAQSDALSQIDKLLEGIDSLTLQRFHSTRPLTDDYRSEMVCFLLEISNRGTMATRLHQALVTLCHYRAFLRTERTMSRDCSLGPHPDQPDATYFADDGIPAVLATDADWSFIHRNAYMLWYVRD